MIGSAVVRSLESRGLAVAPVTRSDADLLDPEAGRALVRRLEPTALVHCAWAPTRSAALDDAGHDLWCEASIALLHQFGASGRHAVVLGSCAEYAWGSPEPLSETGTELRPRSRYGRAKLRLGTQAAALAASGRWRLSWARVFFVHGGHEAADRLVPTVARSLLAGRPAELTHGEQERDYLHVDDVADAIAGLLATGHAGTVNVGSGRALALRSLAEAVAAEVGRPDLLRFGALPSPAGEPARVVADCTRLGAALPAFEPLSLAEAVRRSVAVWRDAAA
jgi:nucleoside-diphosphate-sugar epimerase